MVNLLRLWQFALFLFLKLQQGKLDVEYDDELKSKHFIDGVHNSKYDSNVIMNSMNLEDDLTRISYAEKKGRLLKHLKLIDTNDDKLLDKKEISQFVLNYFLKQDLDDAKTKMADTDKNQNGQIGWDEYIDKVYGYSLEELQSFKNDKSQQMEYFIKMVQDDEGKFKAADQNGDGMLNVSEYGAFLNPSNYPHMQEYEVNSSLKNIDRDNDGFISFEEYLGESTPGKEQRIVDYENFLSYDANGDMKLDRDEIKLWLMPDKKSISEDEAEHLIEETDADEDGLLTFEEIANRLDVWLGSVATDYGEYLKMVDHDEL